MTIRELIKTLLNYNLNGQVTIEYPNETPVDNNYCRYRQAEEFDIVECSSGIILGIDDDNK